VYDGEGRKVTAGLPFDEIGYEEEWSILRRGGVEVRYHNDDDMDAFPEGFRLNGEVISTSPYMTTSVHIDASGRAWAALHATVGDDTQLKRVPYRVFDSEGTYLFDLVLPVGESLADAYQERVLTVRNVNRKTVDHVVRLITDSRERDAIW
jgi:hypothetical protein